MNILVTGANGFLGRALCDYISSKELRAYALLRNRTVGLNVKKTFFIKDWLNHSNWSEILEGIDVVIHTAGLAHVKDRADQDYYEINTEITKKIALECLKHDVRRFIYISSVAVYGISSSQEIISLSTPVNPKTAYGHSKLLAENFLNGLHKEGKLETIIVRPPLIYGPKAPGNIEFLLKSIQKNIPLPFLGVKNLRSMIYVQNLCDVLIQCAVKKNAPGNIFLVGDGIDISTSYLIKYLEKSLNKQSKLFPFPLPLLQFLLRTLGKEEILEKITGSLQCDISHLKETLGWNPPFSVEEGLKKTAHPFKYKN